MKGLVVLSLVLTLALAREGFGPTDQEWGYVTVREGAHMFWWLHYTTADVASYYDRPLVVWLQGGPGGSSTGYGNFAELGPIDGDLNPRNHSWDRKMNVLFVDNPVGTGFSYVDNTTYLTVTNREIADDFLALMKGFYDVLPRFKEVPLYIFSQSYGGKMAAEMGVVIHNAIQNGELDIKLGGLGLGNAWVSPIDSVLTWAPFLLQMAYIDHIGYEAIETSAKQTEAALNAGNYYEATTLWARTEYVILAYTGGIDFYNVLTRIPVSYKNLVKGELKPDISNEVLEDIMNNQVAPALGIDPIWGQQANDVFDALRVDFMKPVTKIVEELLNETDITVAVYSGNLDLIVDTPGTVKWVDELVWTNSSIWNLLSYDAFAVNGIIEGYEKKLGNLHYYTVVRAGHMAPADNPSGMDYILTEVTNNFAV